MIFFPSSVHIIRPMNAGRAGQGREKKRARTTNYLPSRDVSIGCSLTRIDL